MIKTLVDDVVKKILPIYSVKLKENMVNKENEYNDLCKRMDTAEKMREEALRLEKDLSSIKLISDKANSIKGAIEDVVKS